MSLARACHQPMSWALGLSEEEAVMHYASQQLEAEEVQRAVRRPGKSPPRQPGGLLDRLDFILGSNG